MSVFDDSEELLEDFREESRSALENCESAILQTERESTFHEGYAEVFRAFHSIKGLSSMFGLDQIQGHFHHLESLLVKYKEQPKFQPELVDYLLSAVDAATKMVAGDQVVFDLYDPVQGSDVDHVAPQAPPAPEPVIVEVAPKPPMAAPVAKEQPVKQPEAKAPVKAPIPQAVSKDESANVVHMQKAVKKRDIVYVVDDEVDLLDIYVEFLADLNVDVVPFSSAQEALDCIDCTTAIDHPSIIISDLKMPGVDGKQFLEKLKSVNPDIPFIFLSGYLDKDSADFGLAHGAYGVLSKPVNPVELIFSVQSAIAFNKSQKLVRKSLKFLFYFLSQNDSGNKEDKKVLEMEIKTIMDEMDSIRNRSKNAA